MKERERERRKTEKEPSIPNGSTSSIRRQYLDGRLIVLSYKRSCNNLNQLKEKTKMREERERERRNYEEEDACIRVCMHELSVNILQLLNSGLLSRTASL